MIRFIIFILFFAVIFAAIGQWIYLLLKKAKMKNEKAWNKINEDIENEFMEKVSGNGQKVNKSVKKSNKKTKKIKKN